jgi:rhodanese-related sulfurtransferase
MQTETTENGTLETWTTEEVAEAIDRGDLVLIDVRTPQEYLNERIAGAMNYPMQEFDPATLPEDGAKRIVFHCGSGKRSETVARKTLASGRARIAHMEGGFGAWKEGGLPHISTDPSTGGPKKVAPAAS